MPTICHFCLIPPISPSKKINTKMHLYLTRDIDKGLDYNKEKSTFAVSRFFIGYNIIRQGKARWDYSSVCFKEPWAIRKMSRQCCERLVNVALVLVVKNSGGGDGHFKTNPKRCDIEMANFEWETIRRYIAVVFAKFIWNLIHWTQRWSSEFFT